MYLQYSPPLRSFVHTVANRNPKVMHKITCKMKWIFSLYTVGRGDNNILVCHYKMFVFLSNPANNFVQIMSGLINNFIAD